MLRHLMIATSLVALAAPAAVVAQPSTAATPDAQTAALNAFFADYDRQTLARSPMAKSFRAIVDADYARWDDFSDAKGVADHAADMKALADMRARFDPKTLSPDGQLSFRLFEGMMARRDAAFAFRNRGYAFDQMNGAQSQLPAFLINIHRVRSKADAEAYVARLQSLGPALAQIMADAKANAAAGTLPPKWVFPYVINDARNLLKGAPFDGGPDTALYADLKAKVGTLDLPQAEKDALVAAGAAALTTSVKPAYERLIALMTEQMAVAGKDDGVWRFADGAAYYRERLANYTTTGLTAEQVHQLGLDQVARIHGEMRGIMAKTGFEGDLSAFFTFMRTDPRFYAPNSDAGRQLYLDESEKANRAITPLLPQWFGTLPKAPLVVKRVEAFREKSAGKAFYQRPAPDGSRPGTYYANLYNMADMPLTEVEALFYHEGVPGHHLQLAIQTELKDVPAFRQFGGVTAYSEGWGLYSEKLAKDMGLYTDPYRDFGRLQLELHRAIRLVVDTGLHHKRWTRERAIQYVEDNSADAPGGIVKAIERYIVYPGQATAYMVGRLKISELRDKAQAALGDRFDVRGFHDVVLLAGAVPLDVLEERVDAWVKSKKA
jgi:uncharacterized protein (DUF885 family)